MQAQVFALFAKELVSLSGLFSDTVVSMTKTAFWCQHNAPKDCTFHFTQIESDIFFWEKNIKSNNWTQLFLRIMQTLIHQKI